MMGTMPAGLKAYMAKKGGSKVAGAAMKAPPSMMVAVSLPAAKRAKKSSAKKVK